jgi:hypothetical protein
MVGESERRVRRRLKGMGDDGRIRWEAGALYGTVRL